MSAATVPSVELLLFEALLIIEPHELVCSAAIRQVISWLMCPCLYRNRVDTQLKLPQLYQIIADLFGTVLTE